MAKKPKKADEKPQIERFREAVRDMVTAGELNRTEADEAFERVVRAAVLPPREPTGKCSPPDE